MAVDFVKVIGVLSILDFFLLFFLMDWRYTRHVDLSDSMLARLWVMVGIFLEHTLIFFLQGVVVNLLMNYK